MWVKPSAQGNTVEVMDGKDDAVGEPDVERLADADVVGDAESVGDQDGANDGEAAGDAEADADLLDVLVTDGLAVPELVVVEDGDGREESVTEDEAVGNCVGAEQPADELINEVPAAQLEHCVRPSVSVNWPGGHGRQAFPVEEAPAARNDPRGQVPVKAVHADALGLFEYVPGAQGTQLKFAAIQRVPRAHATQDAEPAAENELIAHGEHERAPPLLKVFNGQVEHALARSPELVPALHSIHSTPLPNVPPAQSLQREES
jgi:hypothetical protein